MTRRRPGGILAALTLVVAAVLAVGGCASAVHAQQRDNGGVASAASGQAVPRGGDLRVGILGDLSPKTFLQIGTDSLNGQVIANVFDTLIRYTRDGLTVRPSLATSWTQAPDGRSLTLNLRDDVHFHDGRPFVSSDVENSIKAYLGGPWTPQFKRTAAAITGFDTTDPHRVVLHFAHPISNIFDLLDSAPIIDITTLAQLKAGKVFNGTGPFRFAGWQPNSSLKLVRNNAYWGGSPPLASVTFDIATDQQSLYTRLRTGQIDVAYGLNYHDQQLATSRYNFSEVTLTGAESQEYVGIDVSNPALADVRVRQAIAYAIDRRRIIDDVFRGSGYVVNLPWPKWSPAYSAADNEVYRRDVAKARALVAAHGRLPTLTLDYSSQGVDRVIAEIVQSNLEDAGIPVKLVPNDQTQQATKLIGGKFGGLWLLQHGFAQFTPSTLAVSAYPFNAAKNSSNYQNPDYTAAATDAWTQTSGTSPAALAAYRRLGDVMLRDLFLVEIGVVFQKLATTHAVGNIDWDKRNQLHLATTYLGRSS
ncbi:ABC transporter substrate-binding protein [Gordonia jinhuaensis]|uniref:ABC transporter substrate-binding protein n=1 Tax=Gordonia jinhuaensis TaxID=1517702 RepID=A0A916T9V9_9ACTN|nr:ABC transporter substrate-binding protein [Gordonia jinhuaensis]GGB37227.1 ABC transporter substrate-binding protein [Gordonia jinhuaensis]